MSGIDIITCECGCADGCECETSTMHLACGRDRLEVHASLPDKGVTGTTYFVGDNASGYVEYVWDTTRGFVRMGTAAATSVNQMTVSLLGLGKLSTAKILDASNSGFVGMNRDGQLLVHQATLTIAGTSRLSTATVLTTSVGGDNLDAMGGAVGLSASGQLVAQSAGLNRYGGVRLGSQYQPSNGIPYIVGIGASSNPGIKGQICFNLSPTQSDGSPGVLVYERVSNNPVQFAMKIREASYSQMGVVKMLHSLGGYTEAEIEACRTTHAASVGLVLDGLDEFCSGFFVDARMQGYFDTWAQGKNLPQQIWDDTRLRAALLESVSAKVLADDSFSTFVERTAVGWLSEHVSDAYVENLFIEAVLAKTQEISEAHWNDDLDRTLDALADRKIDEKLPDAMAEFVADPENVEVIAEAVKSKVEDLVSKESSEAVVEYTKRVFNSEQAIKINGVETTFASYINTRLNDLVTARLAGMNSAISAAEIKIAMMREGRVTETLLAESLDNRGVCSCEGYDFVGVSTSKGHFFLFEVWKIKKAFAAGKAFFFLDVWEIHDDDVEYDGSQIRISPGWVWLNWYSYNSSFPLKITGYKYNF